jgi:hypothetical protein
VRVEASLAWAIVRRQPGAWLLLALGVAVATFLPLLAAGLRAESSVAAVRAAVAAVPPPQRAVLAVTSRDIRGPLLAGVDGAVRRGMRQAGLTKPRQVLSFRPLAVGGATFTLAADADLASDVHLRSGRLPRTCRPYACEVLSVRPDGAAPARPSTFRAAAEQLRLVVTGTAVLTDQRLVGTGLLAPDADLLMGNDPAGLAELAELELFGRTTGWLATIDETHLATQGVPRFVRALSDIADSTRAAGPVNVLWPSGPITQAADRASVTGRRFAVLGAGAGALQIGFCLVVAAARRRPHQVTRHVLSRRSGSAAQLTLVATWQSLPAVLLGLMSGVALGAGVLSWRSRSISGDPLVVVGAALAECWPTLLGLAVLGGAVVVAVLSWPPGSGPRTQLVVDVLGAAAVAALVLALAADQGSGDSPLAVSAVVLVAAVTGLVAARCWRPLLTVVQTSLGGPGRSLRRVALLGSLRRPLLPMVTTGFVAAACCTLVFAGGYRASLHQSALDQAAATVPLDIRVAPSARVAAPSMVLDEPRLEAIAPGVRLWPVISSTVTAFAGAPGALAVPLTGLDPEVLPIIKGFAVSTGATESGAELARRLALSRSPSASASPVIPAGTRLVSFPVQGADDRATVSLWVAGPHSSEYRVDLRRRGKTLQAVLAPGPELAVRALEVSESTGQEMRRQHGVGEGRTDRPLTSGRLLLGLPSADGQLLPWSWSRWYSDHARLRGSDTEVLRVRFQLRESRTVITPAPPDDAALPVLVDPVTAARAAPSDTIPVTVNGRTVAAHIVGVLPRFPALGPRYIIADQARVIALLDRTAPGTAAVAQVWIEAPEAALPAVRAALESSPASTATLLYRDDLARSLSQDAVATRSILLLGVAGLVSLLLSTVAIAAAVRGEVEQSASDQLTLELDGHAPAGLRRVLLWREVVVAVTGVVVGVLGGWTLTAVAIRLLITGPGGGRVEPPLRLVLDPALLSGITGGALLATGLAAALVAGAAYRSALPVPPESELR